MRFGRLWTSGGEKEDGEGLVLFKEGKQRN